MTLLDKILTGIAVLSLSFGGLTLTGCEEEGPFERTGENIDDGIDDLDNDVNDGLDDAADDLEDGVDEVGDDIEDGLDDIDG